MKYSWLILIVIFLPIVGCGPSCEDDGNDKYQVVDYLLVARKLTGSADQADFSNVENGESVDWMNYRLEISAEELFYGSGISFNLVSRAHACSRAIKFSTDQAIVKFSITSDSEIFDGRPSGSELNDLFSVEVYEHNYGLLNQYDRPIAEFSSIVELVSQKAPAYRKILLKPKVYPGSMMHIFHVIVTLDDGSEFDLYSNQVNFIENM